MTDQLRIQSEHPIDQIWMHLEKYESVSVARALVEARAAQQHVEMQPQRAEAKAVGVAYAVRNAREYFLPAPPEWTKRILTGYYGLLSFLTAILIADPATADDLEAIEQATAGGHGLKSVVEDGVQDLLAAQRIYVSGRGLFPKCLASFGVAHEPIRITAYRNGWDEMPDAERARTVPLDQLFARVPEIAPIYSEATGREPLCANVGYKDGNALERANLWIRGYGGRLTAEQIRDHLRFPGTDIRVENEPLSNEHLGVATFTSRDGKHWWATLPARRSPMAPMSWFTPVLGAIHEPLLMHCMLMYGLSIVVRYKPKLWREVTEGSLDKYFALVRSYATVVDRVIPQLVLARLTRREVETALPGTMQALI